MMDVKRKNNERRTLNIRVLIAALLIGFGLLVLLVNPVISSVTYTAHDQTVEQVVSGLATSIGDAGSTLGETAGDIGSSIGEAAGQVGQTIGETAGGIGRDIGNLFADNGPTVSEQLFSWLPLLLIVVGLVLILRRPQGKAKNDWAGEED